MKPNLRICKITHRLKLHIGCHLIFQIGLGPNLQNLLSNLTKHGSIIRHLGAKIRYKVDLAGLFTSIPSLI